MKRLCTLISLAAAALIFTACPGSPSGKNTPAVNSSSSGWNGPSVRGVALTTSVQNFRHWNYSQNADHTLQPYTATRSIVSTNFNIYVIENEYLIVKVLPEFGARILSIFYKPTGHEELYQNPVGSPYGRGEGNFYYDWLMVYGGIFPTFPEPEHGKAWCLPWSCAIVSNGTNSVSIKMTKTDNITYTNIPGKFYYGITGISCEATVTVNMGRSAVDMNVKLINPSNVNVNYEYWTCTTLTPGSVPGNTFTPDNSEMIVPIRKYRVKDPWWPWIMNVDTVLDAGNKIYQYQKLAKYQNWADMGIAYAVDLTNCWWGVINQDAKEGMFRIADNRNQTVGLKFWTWGCSQAKSVDPEAVVNCTNGARSYIELWGGVSPAFFSNAVISAGGTKTWTESYFPTVGLTNVNYADSNTAAYLTMTASGGSQVFGVDVFSAMPDQPVQVSLDLTGTTSYPLTNFTASFSATVASTIRVTRAKTDFAPGTYQLRLTVSNAAGLISQGSVSETL